MKKCDVCSKNSLLPENFGNINICKICFLKINGPMWKYVNIESGIEISNYQNKVNELAQKNNFPQNVIIELNNYFNTKQGNLRKCYACGRMMKTINDLNGSSICKECFSKINIKEWKNKNYISRGELQEEKQKILNIAKNNNFPANSLTYISDYFDNKMEKGLIFCIDGKREQILKVYDDYFSITTTEDFDYEGVAEEYAEAYEKDFPELESCSKEEEKAVASGIIGGTGGFVKEIFNASLHPKKFTEKKLDQMADKFINGIEKTMENVVDVSYEKTYSKKKKFKKISGTKIYKYDDFSVIDFREIKEDSIGYLKFQNKETINNTEYDVIFFYGYDSSRKIKEMMNAIYSYLQKKIKMPISNNHNNINLADNTQAVENIKRLKELLDIGAITQEEYDKKKKELLNL